VSFLLPEDVVKKAVLFIDYAIPFKFYGSVVGFKAEKLEPKCFIKSSKDVDFGKVTSELEYDFNKKKVELIGKIAQKTNDFIGKFRATLGFTDSFSIALDEVSASKDFDKVKLDYKFEFLNKTLSGSTSYDWTDVGLLKVKADTKEKDPLVSLRREIGSNNAITPGIYLKTGKAYLGLSRKWTGGKFDYTYDSKDNTGTTVLKDDASNGAWYVTSKVKYESDLPTLLNFKVVPKSFRPSWKSSEGRKNSRFFTFLTTNLTK